MTTPVRFIAVLSPLLVALAACARVGGPAPIVAYGAGNSPAPVAASPSAHVAAAVPTESASGDVVVRPGDTLYGIARRASAPTRAIIEANHLQPPYILRTGQHLTIPQVRTYVVQAGDTLSGVARRFGVGTTEMVRANALAPPYNVHSGQLLVLPETAPPVTAVASAAPPPAFQPASPSAAPIVESAVLPSPSQPARAAPAGVMVAEPVAVAPAPVPVAPVAPSPLHAAAAAPMASPVAVLSPPPAAISVPTMPAVPAQPIQPVSLPGPAPIVPDLDERPVAGRGMLWPLRGEIVSDFGGKPGGLQNDGINIGAPRGTPIRAADAGTVVYAGNELRGFGNLLLIRHKDGWVTAYAHAEELLVKRGDQVRRGQAIARVGSTGNVTTPQLHFEVRKGSRPLNPRDYLGPQTASATP
jgi:murein DD-endopeptidase MepM/ murein hydrolase activator NlpD